MYELYRAMHYSVSQKNPPCGFLTFCSQTDGNFLINFYTPIYTFYSTIDYKFLFNYLQLNLDSVVIVYCVCYVAKDCVLTIYTVSTKKL